MSQESLIKTPSQLAWAVALGFIVPVILIVLIVNFVVATPKVGPGSDAMSEKAIAQRLAPVARFELAADAQGAVAAAAAPTTAPAPAPASASASASASAPAAKAEPPATKAAPAPAPAAAPAPTPAAPAPAPAPVKVAQALAASGATVDGSALYKQVCSACHAAGVAGAPKFGDKAAWAPRIKQGMEVLYTSALKGKGIMPPKGGSAASDDQVKAAVQYMVDAAK